MLGSLLHQANSDSHGNTNITPVPNTSAKCGISFQNERGITTSIFDNYQGSINGLSSAPNPIPSPQHLLSAHVRLELASLLKAPQTAGIALVVNGDNMTNESRWLPDWAPTRATRSLYVAVVRCTSASRRRWAGGRPRGLPWQLASRHHDRDLLRPC